MRLVILLTLLLLSGQAARGQATTDIALLHLPGIGGHRSIDDSLVRGLQQGTIGPLTEIYDWTHGDFGMPALVAVQQNRAEAKKIAEKITQLARENPNRRIFLSSHSGGTGLAVWALEELPEGVMIDTLLMIAPALSPQYDLSKALRHVRTRAYTFNSTLDIILSFGTQQFGTMDRQNTTSAGFGGFAVLPSADAKQYAKLVQIPYDPSWMMLGNAGGHVGAMNRLFARTIVAPLLLTGKLPQLPTTQPATQPSKAAAASITGN